MKQTQFTVSNNSETLLNAELEKIRQWCQSQLYSCVLMQVYTEILDRPQIEKVCNTIHRVLPDALIAGCSSNGNIVNGDFSGGSMVFVCTLFEYPSTKVEILQFAHTTETQASLTRALREAVEARPWVKAVELLITIRGTSMTTLCDGLSELPEGVQVFGGGAFCEDLATDDACVFSSVDGYQEKSVVFILFGGEELHVESTFVTGWKPLGSFLDVTAADGPYLKELNHRSAYEIYYKYLHIQNDENFFYNTLEFPFLYRSNGIDIMRAPTASNPDGSLTMTADISEGVRARIAYGDPWTILESAWKEGNELLQFAPECIFVFSCAARRTFWGNKEVGKETEPYQIVAPTSGFYTSGEFLRTNGFVNQHNVTQVIAAMREGAPKSRQGRELVMSSSLFEGKVSMINRMATFIKATTEELEEANRKLIELAVTDGLTGLGNRNAYFSKTEALDVAIREGRTRFVVALFDLNGLKTINDQYGHAFGDQAIVDAARVLSGVFGMENLYRIGGDEFVGILEDATEAEVAALFDRLDEVLAQENRKPHPTEMSISRGCSGFRSDEDCSFRDVALRADSAMYQNKAEYYKQHDRRRR